MGKMPKKQTGIVAKWLNHKGIGFITPDGGDGESDVLVHYTNIKQTTEDGFKSLNKGEKVEYELETDPKNPEKQIAVNVSGPGGEDCKPKEKKPKGEGKKPKEPKSGESEGDEKKPKGKGKGKGKKGKGKKG